MLLEHLIEKASQEPEHDWDSYYMWLVSELEGHEVAAYTFWECRKCITVNVLALPARYGKCRGCGLIHLPYS